MGGGITGFIQSNDTHAHHSLKNAYREKEASLMVETLSDEKTKVPAPTREGMTKILISAWGKLRVDFSAALKYLFVTTALDGSEDYLVSDKLMSLIGT